MSDYHTFEISPLTDRSTTQKKSKNKNSIVCCMISMIKIEIKKQRNKERKKERKVVDVMKLFKNDRTI